MVVVSGYMVLCHPGYVWKYFPCKGNDFAWPTTVCSQWDRTDAVAETEENNMCWSRWCPQAEARHLGWFGLIDFLGSVFFEETPAHR